MHIFLYFQILNIFKTGVIILGLYIMIVISIVSQVENKNFVIKRQRHWNRQSRIKTLK